MPLHKNCPMFEIWLHHARVSQGKQTPPSPPPPITGSARGFCRLDLQAQALRLYLPLEPNGCIQQALAFTHEELAQTRSSHIVNRRCKHYDACLVIQLAGTNMAGSQHVAFAEGANMHHCRCLRLTGRYAFSASIDLSALRAQQRRQTSQGCKTTRTKSKSRALDLRPPLCWNHIWKSLPLLISLSNPCLSTFCPDANKR